MRADPSRHQRFPIALLTPNEMAEADRLTLGTMAGPALMRRAGEAITKAALCIVGIGGPRRVVVVCGPGNNGGDGYVAARLLAEAGCTLVVAALAPAAPGTDAAKAEGLWHGPVLSLGDLSLEGCDLVIDALFGAGLARAIEGDAKALIDRLNRWSETAGMPILSVDVPSGVDGASGFVRGVAVKATETVTFFRFKPGHLLLPGRIYCGALRLADIGIAASVLDTIQPKTNFNQPAAWLRQLPVPTLAGHKYGRGHAVVMSGPIAQTGAARLCARGALRAGAGLVTMATPLEALPIHAASLTAIMTRVADGADGLRDVLADPRKNAVVLGPGLGVGPQTRALVMAALTKGKDDDAPPRSVVLDADALTSFADAPRDLFGAIAESGHAVVLTPHDGEFAKLFGSMLDVAAAKPERTRAAAAVSGAVVVLKGADTVVAAPDGRASIAATDAPWLATAGSGDVLAGIVTGLLAQAMPAFEAASAGVWMHAEAARLFGPGLISEDLPDMLPMVFKALMAEERPI